MIHLIIVLAVVAIVISLVYYILSQIPIPEPARKFINIAIVVIAAVIVIMVLLSIGGTDVRL
jgi:hypothetical protein